MSLFHAALQPALDSNGDPISGATWNFSRSGGLTAANVYSTNSLTTSLGAEVEANGAGRFPNIFLDDGTAYRAILKDAGGTTIKDIDPVNLASGTVNVLAFGVTGDGTTDDTAAAQDALDTGSDIIFPAPGTYMVDGTVANCLKPVSGQTIIIEAGATIEVIPNDLADYSAFRIIDVENVAIVGLGEIVGERGSHTDLGGTHEHGYGIDIRNSSNVIVRDLRFRDFNGDGVYVGGTEIVGQSSNVLIDNITSDNNKRNGLSIVAVDGCVVRGGLFTGSNGLTGAECGIDVEPNPGKASVMNVVLDGVTCNDNAGPGIAISQTICSNVVVIAPTCNDNGKQGITVNYIGNDVKLIGPTCIGNDEEGILVVGDAAFTTKNIHISNPTCTSNTLDGIKIGLNVDGFCIIGGTVSLNGRQGVLCDGTGGSVCDNGLISGLYAHSNSQTTNATYDNIRVELLCHNVRVVGCGAKKGSQANKPRYGVRITGNETTLVASCDLENGGDTANASGVTNTNVRWSENIGYDVVASGTTSGSTDASGDVTVTHGLAATPGEVIATANGTVFANVQAHTKGASTFKLRFFDAAGAAIASTAITADWRASV